MATREAPEKNNPHLTIAVMVDATHMLTSRGQKLALPVTLLSQDELLSGLARHGIRQLWSNRYLPPVASWHTIRWNAEATGPSQSWVHCFEPGTNNECELVFPAADPSGTWGDVDPVTLLEGLKLYRDVVGLSWHRSGVYMSGALLRWLHSRHYNAVPLEVPDLPAPATMRGIEGAAAWLRDMGSKERTMRYIHSYDKNGAYLAAAADLDIGAGPAFHVPSPDYLLDSDLWRPKSHAAKPFPGYYRVEGYSEDPAGSITAIPATAGRLAPRDAGDTSWGVWVTAPTLKMLLQRHMPVEHIKEAYIWRERHQLLNGWYEVLRDARATLSGRPADPAAAVALAGVKATYAAFTGYVSSSKKDWDRSADVLYRPDIRHAVMAQARCNLIRRAGKCIVDDNALPLALAGVDGMYFVSDNPDAVEACPASLKLDNTLAGWKVNPSIPLDSVRDLLEGPQSMRRKLAGLVSALDKLKHGKGGAQ